MGGDTKQGDPGDLVAAVLEENDQGKGEVVGIKQKGAQEGGAGWKGGKNWGKELSNWLGRSAQKGEVNRGCWFTGEEKRRNCKDLFRPHRVNGKLTKYAPQQRGGGRDQNR